jgi:hypothetical protein
MACAACTQFACCPPERAPSWRPITKSRAIGWEPGKVFQNAVEGGGSVTWGTCLLWQRRVEQEVHRGIGLTPTRLGHFTRKQVAVWRLGGWGLNCWKTVVTRERYLVTLLRDLTGSAQKRYKGVEGPRRGTKTYQLTDRQLKCNSDSDSERGWLLVERWCTVVVSLCLRIVIICFRIVQWSTILCYIKSITSDECLYS